MDRSEVLKRVQNRNPGQMDEMEMEVLRRGSHIGMIAGMVICIILMFVKMAAGQPYTDVYTIYCLMVGCQWAYRWMRFKNKRELFYAFLWIGVAAILLVGYMIAVL